MTETFGTETLRSRLVEFHQLVGAELPGVLRIGVAIHEPRTGMLRTFLHSTVGPPPFEEYTLALSESPGLLALAQGRTTRVIRDLALVPDPPAWHTRALRGAGFRSSYTQPFYRAGTLAGFLFFDAAVPDYFDAEAVRRLHVFAEELSNVVLHGLDVVRVLDAVLRTGAVLTWFRDHETAEHVERVSRSTRLLGAAVASRWGLSDEVVEATALFAVAHDIGKVAIPESLITKLGPLDAHELDQMKTHTTVGAEIVDGLVADLGIQDHAHLSILRNVVRSHHELLDGSGYPDGLRGDGIPAEARIVAVADVYDALRSERPYKSAWSPDETLAYILAGSGRQFDPECVEALRTSVKEIEEIRRRLDTRPTQGLTRSLSETASR